MVSATYATRRTQLEHYFDRTAVDAWARLTTTEKVSRIRETVRAGRDAMRDVLLGFLPRDLTAQRVLDAGCGTGALAVEAAKRGAAVTAVDLSPTLIGLARERTPADLRIAFAVGDMADPALGRFDHVVAMDSLIHYRLDDIVRTVAGLAANAEASVNFTVAPRTPMLAAMWTVGRLFPRSDRAPAIEPVAPPALARAIGRAPALQGWRIAETRRISGGFYTSEAVRLVRA